MTDPAEPVSILRQPRAVWAVAFACVVAFMGIGLVDPILPAIARDLKATPSQVELLFTSYMLITGVAMLITGWVSSRIGPKRTLMLGLAFIVAFSALAGSSATINQIVGFRAGWGLGNALFIATALAVIVGAASGGVAGAIILYEAALGLGIAVGPLLGGLLGGISWRGPFFGTAVLMAGGFVAVSALLPKIPKPARKTSVIEPIRALRHPGLLTVALTALFYNFGFFTLLAYTPFPLGMDAHGLGLVFFGWGVGLAVSSVFLAPRVAARFGVLRSIYAALILVALDLLLMGLFTTNRTALVVAVVVAGLFLGINNTLITETVMKVSTTERPIASAGYSFVRFIGGAIAPYLAGRLAETFDPHVPFYVGAAMTVVAMFVLFGGRRFVRHVEAGHAAPPARTGTLLVAVDEDPAADAVVRRAATLARQRGLAVEVLHVRESDVVGEDAVDLETEESAQALVARHVATLAGSGLATTGRVALVVGAHADVARAILDRAARIGAHTVVLGVSGRGVLGRLFGGGDVPALVGARAAVEVVLVAASGPDSVRPGRDEDSVLADSR